MQKELLEKLKTLPPEVAENYYDPDINDLYTEEVFPSLTEEQAEELKDLTARVYVKELDVADFLAAFRELVKDEAEFKDMAVKILGNDFLLIDDYLEAGIMGHIEDLGGDPNLFRYEVPASSVANQILAKAKLEEIDDHLLQRLAKAVVSRILNARTNDQFKGVLTGPAKTSGIGLTEDKAQTIMKLTDENVAALVGKGVKILSDDDYIKEMEKPAEEEAAEDQGVEPGSEEEAAGTETETPETDVEALSEGGEDVPPPTEEEVEAAVQEIIAAPLPEEPPAAVSETMQTVRPEDMREIKDIKEATAPQQAKAVQAEVSLLDRLVDEGVSAASLKVENEDLSRRFKNLVNLYFRDLRDSLETKSKLTMPVTSGGMGLIDAETERVMKILEGKAAEYHRLMNEQTLKQKEAFVAQRSEQQAKAEEREAQAEKASRDETFSRLTGGSGTKENAPAPQPETAATLTPPQPIKPKVIPVIAVSSKAPSALPASPAAPKAATAPPPAKLPGAQAVAAQPAAPKAAPPVTIPAKPDASRPAAMPPAPPSPASPAKPAAAIPPIPAPAAPKAAPMPPLASEAKAVMADVKFTPKLTGPVDELRSLTVKDFRRLSRDPHEATLKIRDKIDLLEEQSFEIKTAGIKAWQDSEVNRLYLDMLRRSLEGKPIMDVIAEKEGKNEPVLAKNEFDAVMELNRKLRFG